MISLNTFLCRENILRGVSRFVKGIQKSVHLHLSFATVSCVTEGLGRDALLTLRAANSVAL